LVEKLLEMLPFSRRKRSRAKQFRKLMEKWGRRRRNGADVGGNLLLLLLPLWMLLVV
jgi:hypothetical protein